MIPPFHRSGYDVLDSRFHVAATCTTETMAEQVVDALNDAEALKRVIDVRNRNGYHFDETEVEKLRHALERL